MNTFIEDMKERIERMEDELAQMKADLESAQEMERATPPVDAVPAGAGGGGE